MKEAVNVRQVSQSINKTINLEEDQSPLRFLTAIRPADKYFGVDRRGKMADLLCLRGCPWHSQIGVCFMKQALRI